MKRELRRVDAEIEADRAADHHDQRKACEVSAEMVDPVWRRRTIRPPHRPWRAQSVPGKWANFLTRVRMVMPRRIATKAR
jgi:hypothetical protein